MADRLTTLIAPTTPFPWLADRIPPDALLDPDLQLDPSAMFWILDTRVAEEVLAIVLQTGLGEAEGNAQIMAAAPQLKSALRELVRAVVATKCPVADRLEAALYAADRALTKADGR